MKHGFIIIHQKEMQWHQVSSPSHKKVQGDYSLTLLNISSHCYIWIIMTSCNDVINKTMVGGVH